jgi:hypothetical protein
MRIRIRFSRLYRFSDHVSGPIGPVVSSLCCIGCGRIRGIVDAIWRFVLELDGSELEGLVLLVIASASRRSEIVARKRTEGLLYLA